MKTNQKVVAAVAGAALTLGAGGLGIIKLWEGKENTAYPDIVGVWTICYGSTGPHVKPGLRQTDEQCDALLRQDLVRFEQAVQRCSAPARLNQNQYDALVSFSFNVGTQGYCNSTMARKVREGDMVGAAAEFPKWSYAKGQWVRGLNNRRLSEQALFLRPVSLERPSYSHDIPPPVVVDRPTVPAPGVGLAAR